MDIRSICVCGHVIGGFNKSYVSPEADIKTLPTLSVVQSIHGSYRIGIDNGELEETHENGVFVAPRGVLQTIYHIPGDDGVMSAQWAFLDVEINRMYKLDDLYTFPLILPPRYNGKVFECISKAGSEFSLIKRLPYLHGLVEILLEVAEPAKNKSEEIMRLTTYIENHYTGQITSEDLCRIMNCSRSVMYQRFAELFGDPPCRYINGIRIRHAQLLLQNTDMSISSIAAAVGIPDQFYFARVFRQMTGMTAGEYRKKVIK